MTRRLWTCSPPPPRSGLESKSGSTRPSPMLRPASLRATGSTGRPPTWPSLRSMHRGGSRVWGRATPPSSLGWVHWRPARRSRFRQAVPGAKPARPRPARRANPTTHRHGPRQKPARRPSPLPRLPHAPQRSHPPNRPKRDQPPFLPRSRPSVPKTASRPWTGRSTSCSSTIRRVRALKPSATRPAWSGSCKDCPVPCAPRPRS